MNRVAAIILALCLVASLIEAKPHFLSKKSRGRGIGGYEPGGNIGGPGSSIQGPGHNNHEPGSNGHDGENDESQSQLGGPSKGDVWDIVRYCLPDDAVRPFDDCMNNAFDGEPEEVRERVHGCLEDFSLFGGFEGLDEPFGYLVVCISNAFHGEPDAPPGTNHQTAKPPNHEPGSSHPYYSAPSYSSDGPWYSSYWPSFYSSDRPWYSSYWPSFYSSDRSWHSSYWPSYYPSDETNKEANIKKEAAHNEDLKKKAAHNAARAQKAKEMMAKKSSIMKALAQKRAMAKGLKQKHAA